MNSEYRQVLGRVIARRREALSLSQESLAVMAGPCRSTVQKVENGKGNPSVEMLLRITKALGVSLADVIVECERELLRNGASRSASAIPDPEPLLEGDNVRYFLTKL